MNPNQNIDTERVGMALAVLRGKVEEVLEISPGVMQINSLAQLPKSTAAIVEDKLWDVFFYGEYYVERVLSDISAPMISVNNKNLFDYHENTYKPFREKMRELIDVSGAPSRRSVEVEVVRVGEGFYTNDNAHEVSLQSEIKNYMNLYERILLNKKYRVLVYLPGDKASGASSIKFSMEQIIDVFQNNWLESEVDNMDENAKRMFESFIDDCEQILHKPYFEPNAWVENETDLFPVFVTDEMDKIPQHIRERIDEIRRSFIFGNWMSAIALSRCLLEYALINKKSLLEKRLNRPIELRVTKSRAKPISELAEIAGEAFPELKDSMETVIEYGNYVMHPFRRTIPGKEPAKHCVKEINKIIGALYSPSAKPPQPADTPNPSP